MFVRLWLPTHPLTCHATISINLLNISKSFPADLNHLLYMCSSMCRHHFGTTFISLQHRPFSRQTFWLVREGKPQVLLIMIQFPVRPEQWQWYVEQQDSDTEAVEWKFSHDPSHYLHLCSFYCDMSTCLLRTRPVCADKLHDWKRGETFEPNTTEGSLSSQIFVKEQKE